MEEIHFDDIEVASPSVVKQAARDFAAVVAETPQFQAFEQAAYAFHQDPETQRVMQAYLEKQKSLRALQMLNALSAEQVTELEILRSAYFSRPVVQTYTQAEGDLVSLCQMLGDLVSESIGLNYAAACGVSCCR